MFTLSSRLPASWLLLFWLYLGWVTVAELLTAVFNVQAGLVCHALLLLALLVHSALGRGPGERQLALALTLAPLTRLLSTTIPLLKFPQAAWYPIVTGPLLLATWLAVRQLGVSRARLNLRPGNWRLQLMLAGLGLGLGTLEHTILHPTVAVATFTWLDFVLFALSLAIFTGFSEELMFRSVLQAVALPVVGRWALVYVAVLFGVLHIGYLSVFDVIFVTAVGLLFGYLVRWGGSILGVTLAHALTNITLFLVIPSLVGAPAALAGLAPWVIGAGSLVGVLGMVLIWRAREVAAPAGAVPARPVVAPAAAPPRRPWGHVGLRRIADPRSPWESWRTATLTALLADYSAPGSAGPFVSAAPGADGPAS